MYLKMVRLAGLVLLLLVVGCGQKGPLYLPTAEPQSSEESETSEKNKKKDSQGMNHETDS